MVLEETSREEKGGAGGVVVAGHVDVVSALGKGENRLKWKTKTLSGDYSRSLSSPDFCHGRQREV